MWVSQQLQHVFTTCLVTFSETRSKPLDGRGCETNARQLSSDVPKNQFPSKTVQQLSITDIKMFLLTGKIGKAYKVRNFLIYSIDEIPAIFSS